MKNTKVNYSNSFISLAIIITSMILIIQCSVKGQNESENAAENNSMKSNHTNMLYKLYITKTKSSADQSRGVELYNEFKEIYEKHEVKVLGVWLNIDNANEVYFMTAFKNQEHYSKFIESMKENDRYQKMSQELAEERESIEVKNLKMAVNL